MIKLNLDSILMRVVEHGWENKYELEMVVDMVIEADVAEMYSEKSHLSDMEAVFDYTGEVRKQIIQRAVELNEDEKLSNSTGE